jgi:hypothetical protein
MNQLPDSPLSAITLMPSTASEVARFSRGIIQAVKNGEVSPLKVLVMLRSLEAVSELVRDEISDELLNEAERYPEKKFDAYGASIEKSELGTKYLYEKSGDVEWEQLNSEFETIKRRKSERETFLKSLKEPMTAVHEPTGEVYKISPPVKTSKSGVKVFLK